MVESIASAALYSPAVMALVTPARLMPLGPGEPNEAARTRLEALIDRELFGGRKIVDHAMAECCRSALWLYHDFLDESHQKSQAIDTQAGSYWHGIMHRREPDFGNANYWFRRVGRHPIHARLAEAARRIAAGARLPAEADVLLHQGLWDCQAFTELCRAVQRGPADAELCCRRLQQAEWEMLFDYCYHATLGDPATS